MAEIFNNFFVTIAQDIVRISTLMSVTNIICKTFKTSYRERGHINYQRNEN